VALPYLLFTQEDTIVSDVAVSPPEVTFSLNGQQTTVTQGTTGTELFEQQRDVVVLRVNGELKDLYYAPQAGDEVEGVLISEPDGLDVLRHSAAHVLAQAVQNVNPDAKLGIGPPIKDGFYYDFDVEEAFTPEDLKNLEKQMMRIIKEGQTFQRRVITEVEGLSELSNEPYKIELIGLKGNSENAGEGASVEVGAGELTIYQNVKRNGEVAWQDLCRGPHLPSTKLIGNGFKLMRSAAAYWRGSEKNPMLQRVYGTAWPSKDELTAATTASSVPKWTSSHSQTKWAPAWQYSTRRAESSA